MPLMRWANLEDRRAFIDANRDKYTPEGLLAVTARLNAERAAVLSLRYPRRHEPED